MEKLSYTTEFTLWPVPHARPLIDGKPEPGAHPAEYLHPGKLHLETSDDNYVDLYIVPPLFKPGYPRDTSFMLILFLAIFILHKIYSFIIEHFMMNYSLQYPLILFGKIAIINML